jgi:uncharacterized membrane protein YGL010W
MGEVLRAAPPVSASLSERLFIVPDAHYRVDALDFQLEMYELFHRTPVGRLGHALGTPTVLLGTITATLAMHPALGIAFAAAVGIGMTANTFRLDRPVAIAAAVATVGLALAAYGVTLAAGAHGIGIGIGIALGGCAVQTLSHLAEEVPPPQSLEGGFVPMGRWLRIAGVRALARSVVQTLGVFFWLELWASLRILPLQLLHLAMRSGYRPELRRVLDARVKAIVAGEIPDWRDAGAPR